MTVCHTAVIGSVLVSTKARVRFMLGNKEQAKAEPKYSGNPCGLTLSQ